MRTIENHNADMVYLYAVADLGKKTGSIEVEITECPIIAWSFDKKSNAHPIVANFEQYPYILKPSPDNVLDEKLAPIWAGLLYNKKTGICIANDFQCKYDRLVIYMEKAMQENIGTTSIIFPES
jgi:hypothetical protein